MGVYWGEGRSMLSLERDWETITVACFPSWNTVTSIIGLKSLELCGTL